MFKRLGGYALTLAIILMPPRVLYPMRDALASFKVLKVWIVPSKSVIVYLYLIVMVLPFV